MHVGGFPAASKPVGSLHISGKLDVNPVLPLLELYVAGDSLVHSDGHKVIPSSGGREEADLVAQTIAVAWCSSFRRLRFEDFILRGGLEEKRRR